MSYHARTCLLFHCVFATKNRIASIPEDLQSRLWAYMGGIARTNNMKALSVGGIADNCHILLSLPPTIAIAKAIQLVKAGSSKWMHEQTRSRRFEWQEGYGAFSIGASQVPGTIRYIENQPRHHGKVTLTEEWEMFLKKHAPFMYAD
jgi:REP element-mobilizing transposase RayT